MKYQPVIIIGAPRSGTNLLRDVLTSVPKIATWPCDEINYIWRYGNAMFPSDELDRSVLTPRIRSYIRSWFDWVANRHDASAVVEKTCANCLRPGFVEEVVPEAKYIIIRRNGIDAVVSAVEKWRSRPDMIYVARKARFVPPGDLPFYAYRYLRQRVSATVAGKGPLSGWGPVMHDSYELLRKQTALEYCATQWSRCVDSADQFARGLADARCHEVEYEQFVSEPQKALGEILEFLGLSASGCEMQSAVESVRRDSVGKGVRSIGEPERRRVEAVAGTTLHRLGYI